MVEANLGRLRERIEHACRRSGRKAEEVTLVAVTKKVPRDKILEAASLGVRDFGESYVQEAEDKIAGIEGRWHMIGHLQSNKAGRAARIFDVIGSVDSLKLLAALDRKAAELGKVQECLIEVKFSRETGKTGLPEPELPAFCKAAKDFRNVSIGGIMMMAPAFDDPKDARPFFRRARSAYERLFLEKSGPFYGKTERPALSMGMSGDFEAAIEEGSTQVRLGTAIFGERAK